MKKELITGVKGPQGPQGPHGPTGVLATIGVLLAFKLAEAFFATGHSILKNATKNVEKKFR